MQTIIVCYACEVYSLLFDKGIVDYNRKGALKTYSGRLFDVSIFSSMTIDMTCIRILCMPSSITGKYPKTTKLQIERDKKMKRIIALLLGLSLALSCMSALAFNAEGFPVVDETAEFNVVCISNALNAPYAEMELFQELGKKTNVNITFEEVATNYTERKNLIFAAGVDQMPDAFFGKDCTTDNDIIRYSAQGLLLPLEDIIDQYCPNIRNMLEQRPGIRSLITAPDGHIYSLPCIEEQTYLEAGSHFFINKTWLDKVGLPVPTTTDEYYNALKAFKEAGDLNGNGKDDEIPLSFRYSDWCDGISCLFGAFGIPDDLKTTAKHMAIDEDGKTVVCVPTLDSYKAGVQWLNKLYSEGLIDVEAMTQDASQYGAKGLSADSTYGSFLAWSDFSIVGWDKCYDEYTYLLPLKGPDGHQNWTYNNQMWVRNAFSITAACEQPEVLMRWMDGMYETDKSVEWTYGQNGKCIDIQSDVISWLPSPEGMNQQEFRQKTCPANGPACILKETTALMDRSAEPGVVRRTERTNAYREFLYMNYYPNVYLTEEQTMMIDMLNMDINTYMETTTADWIVNGGIEEGWDAYIQNLNNMGLQDMIAIYQDAYDIYIQ